MMSRFACAFFAFTAACGFGVHHHPHDSDGGGPDGNGGNDGVETHALAMNDISMVMPTLLFDCCGRLDGTDIKRDLVPRSLYARIGPQHHDITADFDDFLVFGIRFDLCDRTTPGPCPTDADGSLRIVFQPVGEGVVSVDAAIHAFYSIPNAELGDVVNRLRGIARINQSEQDTNEPLKDFHFHTQDVEAPLKALLDSYAVPERLIRLAAMGQDTRSATPLVVFRQLELVDDDFVDTMIPGIDATEQTVAVADTDPSYTITPVVDEPAGFSLTTSATAFNAATLAVQGSALDALEAAVNPRLNTPQTVQCATCHIQTFVTRHRVAMSGVDISSLPSHFTSQRNLVSTTAHETLENKALTDEHSLHAFSWFVSNVSIAQRVANETAIVLDEIDQRFPVPH